jgi:hypothetical protein
MAGNSEERADRSTWLQPTTKCHSERSEESLISPDLIARGKYTEMFRFAQHDSAIYEMIPRDSDCGFRILD